MPTWSKDVDGYTLVVYTPTIDVLHACIWNLSDYTEDTSAIPHYSLCAESLQEIPLVNFGMVLQILWYFHACKKMHLKLLIFWNWNLLLTVNNATLGPVRENQQRIY